MTHSNDPLYGRHFFAAAFLPCFSKLTDLNFAFGKDYGDYQLSSHGSDKVLQRADVNVGAALHFRNPASIRQPDSRREFLRYFRGLDLISQSRHSDCFK